MTQENETTSSGGLRILYVATKPAYPPQDGGRLLIWNTLNELSKMGHRITYVAPDLGTDTAVSRQKLSTVCEQVCLVPARPSGMASSAVSAMLTRSPLSVVRHTHRAVQNVVAEELGRQPFDVVHAEQIQAFCNLERFDRHPPVVLRAQNVESQLWRMVSFRKPLMSWIARDEARKMARFEARAIRTASATIVLTQTDAETLAGGVGAPARRISVIRPPFPATLPRFEEPLPGDPPVVLLAGGWLPNRDSVTWFLQGVWPEVLVSNPGAHLHIFGENQKTSGHACTHHSSPLDSTRLFRPHSVLVVPLRIASGIRMKILEAWARGVPVVATPTGVRGLEDVGKDAYLLARDGPGFGAAIKRLRNSRKVARGLVDAGRTTLAEHFNPRRAAEDLTAVYRDAVGRSR